MTLAAGRRRASLGASEQEMLGQYLDFQRATVQWKVDALTDDDLRRPGTPTGLTLLGLVKHLAYAERWWFRWVFAAEEVSFPPGDGPEAGFQVMPNESAADVLDLYEMEIARSREIFFGSSLDSRARREDRGEFSLRWIALHMLEEIARHNGHLDILRENIDGSVGE